MEAVHPNNDVSGVGDLMALRKGFFNTIKEDKVSYSMVRAFQAGYLEGTYKAFEQLVTKRQPSTAEAEAQ